MVIEALIVTAVASAMLGWNVHVIYRSGVCCPPPGSSHAEASSAPSRSVHRSSNLRRRRRPSRRWLKQKQEAEAAAAAAEAAGVSGGSAGNKMEPITENLLTPSTEKSEVGTVNGEGVEGA